MDVNFVVVVSTRTGDELLELRTLGEERKLKQNAAPLVTGQRARPINTVNRIEMKTQHWLLSNQNSSNSQE